jgi:uncharacterized protein YndB with AHSA1/START domain
VSEYEHSTTVQASPDTVFAFVSDVQNLPRYLPTVHNAMRQSGDKVRVQGEAQGHSYDDDGYMRVDQASRRMEWGSDGEDDYSGWLTVAGDDGAMQSTVTVHLAFGEQTGDEQQIPNQDQRIEQGLNEALDAIREQIEQQGGSMERSAGR